MLLCEMLFFTYLVVLIELIGANCVRVNLVCFYSSSSLLLLPLTLFLTLLSPVHTTTLTEGFLMFAFFSSSFVTLLFPDVTATSLISTSFDHLIVLSRVVSFYLSN